MSDLEASLRRISGAAHVSHAAVGKLQAISGKNSSLFAQSGGLVDAFADVFANISQSQAAPAQTLQRETSVEGGDRHDAAASLNATREQRQDVDREEHDSNDDQSIAESESIVVHRDDQQSERNDSQTDSDPVAEDLTDIQSDSEIALQPEGEQEEVETPAEMIVDVTTTSQKPINTDEGSEHTSRKRNETQQSLGPAAAESTASTGEGERPTSTPVNANGQESTDAGGQEAGQQSTGESADLQLPETTSDAENSHESKFALADRGDAKGSRNKSNSANNQPANEKLAGEAPRAPVEANDGAAAPRKAAAAQVASVAPTASATSSTQANSSASPMGQIRSRSFNQAIEAVNRSEVKTDAKPKETQHSTSETVSRARLVQRVSKAFQHLGNEGGIIRMRFAPAELGSVRVEMRVQQRKVEAGVVAETEAASVALRQFLPDLRQRLEAQGMQVERIEIESENSEESFSGGFSGFDRGDQPEQQPRRRSAFGSRDASPASESVSQSVSQAEGDAGFSQHRPILSGVDVRF